MSAKKVIMVTGGTGLVGRAVKTIAETEEKQDNEQWIFLSSKDGDLGYVIVCKTCDVISVGEMFGKNFDTEGEEMFKVVQHYGSQCEQLYINGSIYNLTAAVHMLCIFCCFLIGIRKQQKQYLRNTNQHTLYIWPQWWEDCLGT